MSLWESRFKEHTLWVAVNQLRDAMNSVKASPDGADQEALAYAGMVLELLEKRREDSDGRDVSPAMLSAMKTAVSNFMTSLAGINEGTHTWEQVTSTVDDVVTSLGQWPPMQPGTRLAAVDKAVDEFAIKTSEALKRTSDQAATLGEALSGLGEKQTELAQAVADEQTRIRDAVAEFKTNGQQSVQQLIDAQEDRITASEDDWAKHLTAQRARADEHNELMAEYEEKSRKVLEAVGTNSTATDYGTYANAQQKAADTWRRIAIVVLAAAGAWFVASSFPWFTTGAAVWESSLARLGVTAAVAGVGAYAARESSQHRRRERDAKRIQLVLIALEPFIANLPVNTQDSLREAAARAIFVLTDSPGTSDELVDSPAAGLAKVIADKAPGTGG